MLKWVVYILIIAMVVVLIYLYAANKKKQQVKKSIMTILSDTLLSVKPGTKGYDYALELDKVIILVKLINVPGHMKLVVTNPVTWIVAQKTSTLKVGNRIKGIDLFMKAAISSDKKIKRLAVVYTECGDILKYINEHEMVFVNFKTDVYGCNIVRYRELNAYFTEVLPKF